MDVTFEQYRNAYDRLSFAEHQALYGQVAAEFPEQSYWNAVEVERFLRHYYPECVVEIGGWDGGLANTVPYSGTWTNLELADVPQVCAKPGYRRVVLTDWLWNRGAWGDAVVMSHVIEHMSEDHIRRLLGSFEGQPVYVDAPLEEDKWTNWKHSTTTHVLGHSFSALDVLFAEHGYQVAYKADSKVNPFPSVIRWYEWHAS